MRSFQSRLKEYDREYRRLGVPDDTQGLAEAKAERGCVIRAFESATDSRATNWEYLARTDDARRAKNDIDYAATHLHPLIAAYRIVKTVAEDRRNIRKLLRDVSRSNSPLGKALQGINISHHSIEPAKLADKIRDGESRYIAMFPNHAVHLGVNPQGIFVRKSDQGQPIDLSSFKKVLVVKVTPR